MPVITTVEWMSNAFASRALCKYRPQVYAGGLWLLLIQAVRSPLNTTCLLSIQVESCPSQRSHKIRWPRTYLGHTQVRFSSCLPLSPNSASNPRSLVLRLLQSFQNFGILYSAVEFRTSVSLWIPYHLCMWDLQCWTSRSPPQWQVFWCSCGGYCPIFANLNPWKLVESKEWISKGRSCVQMPRSPSQRLNTLGTCSMYVFSTMLNATLTTSDRKLFWCNPAARHDFYGNSEIRNSV